MQALRCRTQRRQIPSRATGQVRQRTGWDVLHHPRRHPARMGQRPLLARQRQHFRRDSVAVADGRDDLVAIDFVISGFRIDFAQRRQASGVFHAAWG